MCPNSIYFGLPVVPLQVLWGQFILVGYMGPSGLSSTRPNTGALIIGMGVLVYFQGSFKRVAIPV